MRDDEKLRTLGGAGLVARAEWMSGAWPSEKHCNRLGGLACMVGLRGITLDDE